MGTESRALLSRKGEGNKGPISMVLKLDEGGENGVAIVDGVRPHRNQNDLSMNGR